MRVLAPLCALFPSLVLAQDALESGTWRAWLDVPGGELPFGIELVHADGGWTGFLVNEPSRVPIETVEWDGRELSLELPSFDSRIHARADATGRALDGEWEKVRGKGEVARVPFHAHLGIHERFPVLTRAVLPKNVAGRWAVDFSSDEKPAVAIFEQEVGSPNVTGTFLTATGDYRYVAGSIDGATLSLSCFDGGHAFLFRARVGADGGLAGDFWSGDWWHETWTAKRDESAQLDDPFAQTRWSERASLAGLVFPDLDGILRSLGSPAYAGKAYVLQVFGSWCPNCHDETRMLVELDARYRERGLVIVGLAFELTGDAPRDRGQVRAFAERYGVEYPLFLVGTADKAEATRAFGHVDRVRSFPTTIFMDASGEVRAVHSGFAGPATGAEHERLRADFERRIEGLLAEPDADEATWERLRAHPWHSDDEFAGASYAFEAGAEGERVARYALLGSGVRVLEEETRPVWIHGDAVRIGDELWRLDLQAGVLLSPLDAGRRLYPEGGSRTPSIERIAGDEERVVAALDPGSDPLVRREAIVALAELRRDAPEPRLPEVLPLLDDEELEVRLTAIWAVGDLQQRDARERLAAEITHPNALVRLAAVRALIRMHDPHCLLAAKPAENDPVQDVRELVMDALTENPDWWENSGGGLGHDDDR